jgi:hypothetical protein
MTPSPTVAAAPTSQRAGRLGWVAGCIACLLVGLFLGHAITYHWMEHRQAPGFLTPYQAVLLSNGAVYYGKLEGYGTRHATLTDVYYIVTKTDPTTKQVTNVLVKRGKELHGPDRMYLNPDQIVFVEPVGTDSKVAQLIDQAAH